MSAEELEMVRAAAIMQDGSMRAAFNAIKPGMRDTEVAAVVVHVGTKSELSVDWFDSC